MREQVARWQAENDVLQVLDCMICCCHRHRRVLKILWYGLLLTHPVSVRRPLDGVRKMCAKEEITLLLPAARQNDVSFGSQGVVCRFGPAAHSRLTRSLYGVIVELK